MASRLPESVLRAQLAEFRERTDATLLDAALLVARCIRGVDEARVLERIDELALAAMAAVPSVASGAQRVSTLCDYLREGAGLVGNDRRAFELEDSFLPKVLAGGAGIPITLSIAYVEVARRIGLQAEGINFPGHFLARVTDEASLVVIDAFAGRVVDRDDCIALLRRVVGEEAELADGHFDIASPRAVLVRMLNNLKHQAVAAGRVQDALDWSARILAAEPGLVFEHRDRAALHLQLGEPDLAIAELSELAEAVDEPALRERVLAEIDRIRNVGGAPRVVH